MNQTFFMDNRARLSEAVHGSLVILTAYSALQRGNDAAHHFEQEANFWYLTGVEEPDWWVIVDGSVGKSWLVAPDINDVHRIFEGGLRSDEAQKISGVNHVVSYKDAETLLRNMAKKHSLVRAIGEHPHKDHFNFVENPASRKLWMTLERIFNSVQDCRPEIAKLRAIKQPEEIQALKKAIRLTTQGFEDVKVGLSTVKHEYEIEAEFDHYFKRNGAGHAYDPIIANGKNACTLHYNKNNAILKKNSLVLMDVGARLGGYVADVTRTFSVGVPTKRQIAVHAAVEEAHIAIIKLLKPGLSVATYYEKVDDIMKQALIKTGLMEDMLDEENYRKYFPHAISHGLGIDAHDPLGTPAVLKEGMVLTVEPGIYIPQENIGVRIEDDILITKNGRLNLSGHLSTGL